MSGDHERYHGASDESATSDAGGDELTPAPARTGATVYEPPRETPVHAETDVLVIGGGPAGCAAALAARRLGAQVTLVERYNHLGGLSTGGLVLAGLTMGTWWAMVGMSLAAMGFYDDFCVKFDGRWLIKEKRIYRCDDETPLPW